MLNIKKDEVQQKALEKWIENNKIGTCEIATGIGKTFIALHALCTMSKKDTHLFLAETTSREKDLLDDIAKYKSIFGIDILKEYDLKFYCYQTVYKWKNKSFGLIIADEIHDSLSPAYSEFYKNNSYKAIIGLSATINRQTSYDNFTKGELLDKIAPVCFTYDLVTAQQEGTSRKLIVFVIQHDLDDKNKTVQAGNDKKRFTQTEKAAYDFWDKQHKRAWYLPDDEVKKFKIRMTSHKRSHILYNLQSKIPIVTKLLLNLKGKSIVFGNSLDSLYKITPNVISSRQSDTKNNAIREAFDKNKIHTIGSFKKLKQGSNLKGLDNCIIMSYYSTEKDIIQRMGRLRQNGEVGYVFIILTKGTQEEVWFSKMTQNLDNIEQIYCPDVDFCLKKYKEYENIN